MCVQMCILNLAFATLVRRISLGVCFFRLLLVTGSATTIGEAILTWMTVIRGADSKFAFVNPLPPERTHWVRFPFKTPFQLSNSYSKVGRPLFKVKQKFRGLYKIAW